MTKPIKDFRMQLWCDVFVAVASSSNVLDSKVCTNWANNALNDFDKRFRVRAEKDQVDEANYHDH